MRNFPNMLAVIGAWLCATGLYLPGIVTFMISSIWSIIVDEDTSLYTLAFFGANIVAFFRIN
jgi:hypothetical protein